jgi:hypothetical protein
VFPHVQTWRTHSDLLLLASRQPLVIDPARLRARLASEPFAAALRDTWRVTDLEGFLARFVASDGFGAILRPEVADLVNTDDVNRVEFGFARSVGRAGSFWLGDLRAAARRRGLDRPRLTESGSVDWARVAEESARLYGDDPTTPGAALTPDARARLATLAFHARGDLEGAARAWLAQDRPPRGLAELVAVAESFGRLGRDEGRLALEALTRLRPAEADLVRGSLAQAKGAVEPGVEALERAFTAMRQDPWCEPRVAQHGLDAAIRLAAAGPTQARRLYRALHEPLAARAMESERVNALVSIALSLDPAEVCVDVLGFFEPYPIWTREFLGYRARCYASQRHPRAASAERDLREFLQAEPFRLEDGLVPLPLPAP